MRCCECRQRVSPGPEFCPLCGGGLDITAIEILVWSARRGLQYVSAPLIWTLSVAMVVTVTFIAALAQTDGDMDALLAFGEQRIKLMSMAAPTPQGATITPEPQCGSRCGAVDPGKAGYVLKRFEETSLQTETGRVIEQPNSTCLSDNLEACSS